MTCKDCLGNYLGYCKFDCSCAEDCENFQTRYMWVKFPCLTGTTVYSIYHEISGKRNVAVGTVERFSFYGDDYVYVYVFYETGVSYWHSSREFGKTVFLTYEEAERALKGRESNDE